MRLRTVGLVFQEFETIRAEAPSPEELETIQSSLIETFPRNFESKSAMMNLFINDERPGRAPDFWRRAHSEYPSHGDRFTGEPAYFKHVIAAAEALMSGLERTAQDFQWAVFHQPNVKFPSRAAKMLGFTPEKIAPGLLSNRIGNTYAGSAVIGLTAVLDIAEPGDRILVVSYGSGAGSDAFDLRVTDRIMETRGLAPTTEDYIARRKEIDYATYTRYRDKLKMS